MYYLPGTWNDTECSFSDTHELNGAAGTDNLVVVKDLAKCIISDVCTISPGALHN